MDRRGFTLIELLIFTAIFAIIMIGVITMLIAVTRVQSSQSSVVDVQTEGQFLLQRIQSYVQSARLIDMTQNVATDTLTLREPIASSSLDPTTINASSGVAYLRQGVNGTPVALTSGKVIVSDMSFTRHYHLASSSAYGTDSVNYSFTVAENTSNTTKEYSETFQSAAAVAAPVGKIAIIQMVGAYISGTTTLISFPYANEAGNLLIAVVTNDSVTATSSPLVATVSDTRGNSWTEIVNSTSSFSGLGLGGYIQRMQIFAASGVENGTNTVNVVHPSGTSLQIPYAFVFEYRGTATTSFDVSSTLMQISTTAPSSGYATPTSTAELIFGALYADVGSSSARINFSSPPSPGYGFTKESCFSFQSIVYAPSLCVEDRDL